MHHQDDETLIARLQRGDEAAFADIYAKYFKLMATEASYHLYDASAARDVVQEFFRKCLENRTLHNLQLQDKRYLKCYLVTAMRNNSCRYNLQNKKSIPIVEGDEINQLSEPPEPVSDQELEKKIKKLIDELPPMPKVAVTAVYLQELNRGDILSSLGITKKTLRNHLYRGLSELRISLKRTAL